MEKPKGETQGFSDLRQNASANDKDFPELPGKICAHAAEKLNRVKPN